MTTHIRKVDLDKDPEQEQDVVPTFVVAVVLTLYGEEEGFLVSAESVGSFASHLTSVLVEDGCNVIPRHSLG